MYLKYLGVLDRAIVPFLCTLQGMEDGTITRCPAQYKENKRKWPLQNSKFVIMTCYNPKGHRRSYVTETVV